jgi:hypothetical protein
MAIQGSDAHQPLGVATRLVESDISSSRFAIWSNTLSLIRQQPWFGVGWGEFNFAWTLTPFPDRPIAFFDHTHNLILQLVVELGIPIGLTVVAVLAIALWQAFRRSWADTSENGVYASSAFVMVLLMGIHSMLEYPLWYAYFLLPTAFAWGYALGRPEPAATATTARWPSRLLSFAGLLMILGSFWALHDYLIVSRIFEPRGDTRPLQVRIAEGQRSILFGYHADYAATTTTEPPSAAWPAFKRATHNLLDTRLMIAWARALNEKGYVDHARHLAARLREFRHPEAEPFFAPCTASPPPQPLPFQCTPPSRVINWREFLDLP